MKKTDPRFLRYQEKLHYIIKKKELLKENATTELSKMGIFYVLQSLIDAIIDLIAMILKDMGEIVADDYANIDKMVEIKKIDQDFAEKLKKSNGLRNAIAHQYNGLREKEIFDSLDEIDAFFEESMDILGGLVNELGKD